MILSAKIARYILIFGTIITISIVLPEFYSMLFYKSVSTFRTNYSPITNEFLLTEYRVEKSYKTDSNGNTLSRDDFERLTPFTSYRQLLYRDAMPDTINGIPIDMKELRLNNIFLQLRSSDIQAYTIPINPLLESEPGRPNLSIPDEFFRIDEQFEFIHCAKNSVLPKLSKLFNDELVKKGFQFPAKKIFGNPTTRKPFDDGFFIVDNNEKLFHLKRVHNKPYVAKILLPPNIKIQFVAVKEMSLKEFHAIIVTKDNQLFLISYDNYKLIKLPSDGYNYKNTRLIFRGNLLYREINFVNKNSIKVFATDREYKVIDTFYRKWESNEEGSVGIVEKSIFPFKVLLTDRNNSFIDFYFTLSDFQFLLGNIIALLVGIALFETKFKRKTSTKIIDLFIILISGLYGLIAVLLIRDEN
jgi:hypothetical protein